MDGDAGANHLRNRRLRRRPNTAFFGLAAEAIAPLWVDDGDGDVQGLR